MPVTIRMSSYPLSNAPRHQTPNSRNGQELMPLPNRSILPAIAIFGLARPILQTRTCRRLRPRFVPLGRVRSWLSQFSRNLRSYLYRREFKTHTLCDCIWACIRNYNHKFALRPTACSTTRRTISDVRGPHCETHSSFFTLQPVRWRTTASKSLLHARRLVASMNTSTGHRGVVSRRCSPS